MKKEQATHRVSCLLTKKQYAEIKKAADDVGLGMSAFMRQAAMEKAGGK